MASRRELEGDVFLETTAQVARVLGSAGERAEHRARHRDCRLFSSTYVLGEFKKTFLRDAVRFHALLVDSERAADALQRLERTFSDRTHRRSVKLFAVLVEDEEIERDTLLDRLESLIEWQLEQRFRCALVGGLLDETRCARANACAVRADGVYTMQGASCTKRDRPPCGIDEFWRRNERLLRHLVRCLGSDALDRELKRLVEEGRRVVAGDAPEGRTCEGLADAIIALECPRDAALQTTNKRHFGPLCSLLRKKLLIWRWSSKRRRTLPAEP